MAPSLAQVAAQNIATLAALTAATTGIMTIPLHRRMRRLRWTSYTLVVLCYILAYFHRMAPAAIA